MHFIISCCTTRIIWDTGASAGRTRTRSRIRSRTRSRTRSRSRSRGVRWRSTQTVSEMGYNIFTGNWSILRPPVSSPDRYIAYYIFTLGVNSLAPRSLVHPRITIPALINGNSFRSESLLLVYFMVTFSCPTNFSWGCHLNSETIQRLFSWFSFPTLNSYNYICIVSNNNSARW